MSNPPVTTAATAHERAIVISHIRQFAWPGLLTALLLLVMATAGVPAAQSAAGDLWDHAWKVHPLLWAASGLITTSVVLFQNGDFVEDVDRATLPLLHFFAHAYSFSLAAVALLGWTQKMPWADSACGQWAGLVALFFAFLGMATISVSGVLIVERRAASRRAGTSDALSKATKVQLRIFAAMAIVFFISTVYACLETGSTKDVLRKRLGTPLTTMCTAYS